MGLEHATKVLGRDSGIADVKRMPDGWTRREQGQQAGGP